MTTYQGGRRGAPPGRRSRWLLAGGLVAGSLVVGVTGAAAAAGEPAAASGVPSLVLRGADSDGWDRDDRREQRRSDLGEQRSGWSGRGPGVGHRPQFRVPCDSRKLVSALVRANAEGGADLRLAPKCRYELTRVFPEPDDYDGGISDARQAADSAENPGDAEAPPRDPQADRSGLPAIYQPITIRGEGATIVRDSHAEAFRFFTVRDGGELKLSDVVLRNGLSAAEGGSIYVVHGASAVVERTTIVDSTSLSAEQGGGAIFNDGNMVVTGSRFIGNHATGTAGKGGGLLNGGVLSLRTSLFRDNSAVTYGGGLANYRGAAEVDSSTFARNDAAQGGGIASFSARTRVSKTLVVGNKAETGGGIANSDALIFLRDVQVRDNHATGNGGGISTFQGLVPVDDSFVVGNTARGSGGGIFAEKSNLLVRHSTVDRNDAVGADSKGGGLFVKQGKVSLFFSRVAGNDATMKPGGLIVDQAAIKIDEETAVFDNEPTDCAGSTVPITHCSG